MSMLKVPSLGNIFGADGIERSTLNIFGDSNADPAKVLVVYGSETGNVRRSIHKLVAQWQAKSTGKNYLLHIENVVCGNDAALEFSELADMRAKFDVLIIATSSFGEGDPPANFLQFLVQLVRAASHLETPLAGMQHAVVGFGQSVYPTFQNTPRYTDKLLEQLGSRRFAQRVELDEGPDETVAAGADADESAYFTTMSTGPGHNTEVTGRSVGLQRFGTEVQKALLKGKSTADSPHVCAWTAPASKLIEKTAEELLYVRPETVDDTGVPQWLRYVAVALLASGATYYHQQGVFTFFSV